MSAIVQIGVGCALVGFIAIVVAHVIMAVRPIMGYHKKKLPYISETKQSDNHVHLKDMSNGNHRDVQVTEEMIELRESLLIYTNDT